MKFTRIINLLILLAVLSVCSPAHALFGWKEAERLRQQREEEQRRRLAEAEQQLTVHRKSASSWQLAAGSAAVGAMLLLIVGTALGTKTRHAARTQSQS